MVENLKLDVGFSILGGILAGIFPAAVGSGVACVMNRRLHVPLRKSPGTTLAELGGNSGSELTSSPRRAVPSGT